jgi:hypothetical protein
MKILVNGATGFNDYQTYLRGVGVAIDEMTERDDEGHPIVPENTVIEIFSAGPVNVNNFTAEFVNRSERVFKAMGYKVKFHRYPYRTCVSNISTWEIDRVVLFGVKNLHSEPIAVTAKFAGVGVKSYG